MGFLCPKMQQIHSTILEYFCSNTQLPSQQVLCCSCYWRMGGREEGRGWRGGGGGFWLSLSCCMSRAIFQSSLLFCSFPFILQSKEYPRNVPGNPTRKCVEKEVCKKKKEKKEKANVERKRRTERVKEREESGASCQSRHCQRLSTTKSNAN